MWKNVTGNTFKKLDKSGQTWYNDKKSDGGNING